MLRYLTTTELQSRSDPGQIQLLAKPYTLRPSNLNLNISVLIAEDRIKYIFDIPAKTDIHDIAHLSSIIENSTGLPPRIQPHNLIKGLVAVP